MNASIARTSLAAALAALSLVAAAAPASAWTRNSTVTTPRGTYTGSASGQCAAGYGCQRNSAWTGPNGGTATRQGYAYRTGNDSINYGGTATGPYGNSIYRSGTISRY